MADNAHGKAPRPTRRASRTAYSAAMGNTRRLAIILPLVLAGGCATTGGKVTAIIGGVAAVGTVVAASQVHNCPATTECFFSLGHTAVLGLTAGAALFASLVFEVLGAPDLPTPATAPIPTGPPGKPIAAGDDYLPLNFGGRFSTNAAAASR